MYALTEKLRDENQKITVRQQAGLYLKNILYAKDDAVLEQNRARWREHVGSDVKVQIRANILTVLRSPATVARHTAGQTIAEMGAIDLPTQQWPELLSTLLQNITAETPEEVKVSTLECLGYMCERLDYKGLKKEVVNEILTAIVDGIRSNRANAIRFAAAVALRNSLFFCRGNMEEPQERNMIMQVICEATQSEDANVRSAAYECIVQMGEHYYGFLKDYMEVLANLSFQTMKSDQEKVAIQAIEFWNTLADEEYEILLELEEGGTPEHPCQKYVEGGLPLLCPILLEALTKQDEDADPDDDIWNISMAAATCLQLAANTTENAVVPHVMPFVLSNIKNENWRFREASTMAFTSILDGPKTEVIGTYVNQSIPVLIGALRDPHEIVKDTTAWALGRICELHAGCVPQEMFKELVTGLSSVLLPEKPRVSAQACFAIHNLAMQFESDDSNTNLLSAYMGNLLHLLMQVTEREDWDEANLRPSAYQAISMLVQHAAADCKPILLQLLPAILERLQKSFGMQVLTNDDKDAKEGLQSLLCGLIQVLLQQMSAEDISEQLADSIMHALVEVFKTKNATAHEEAFMAAGALSDKLEGKFERYMPTFHPIVMQGLRNFEAYQVATVAVGVVGDLTRALEAKIYSFCNEIVTALLESLQNANLNRSVKPHVLSCFGDIALAIGGNYEPYLQVTLMMLLQASQSRAPDDDEDMIDYVNTLREGILEAYTGIIQGLNDGNKVNLIQPYSEAIMGFLENVSHDQNIDDAVLSGAIGVLGDLTKCLGNQVPNVRKPFVMQLLKKGHETGDQATIDLVNWTNGNIQSLSF